MKEKIEKYKPYIMKGLFVILVLFTAFQFNIMYNDYKDNIEIFLYDPELKCIVDKVYVTNDNNFLSEDIVEHICNHNKSSMLITKLYIWYDNNIYPVLMLLAILLIIRVLIDFLIWMVENGNKIQS